MQIYTNKSEYKRTLFYQEEQKGQETTNQVTKVFSS